MSNVDPEQEYFVYSTDSCTFQDDVSKCLDGDVTLDQFLSSKRNLPKLGWRLHDMLTILEALFIAVILLIENELVHQDIRLCNIVVNKDGLVRVVDTGFLVDHESLYKDNPLFKSNFFANPPEHMMMRSDVSRLIQSVEDIEDLEDGHTSSPIFTMDHDKSFKKLLHERTRCPDLQKFVKIAIDREWHKKADIYSLGIVLVLCARLVHNEDMKNNELFQLLVHGMIMPHPDDRFDMSQIQSVMKEIHTVGRPVK